MKRIILVILALMNWLNISRQPTLKGQPPKELVEELAKRPSIAFIQATDSTEVTLNKAQAAIRLVEQSVNNS